MANLLSPIVALKKTIRSNLLEGWSLFQRIDAEERGVKQETFFRLLGSCNMKMSGLGSRLGLVPSSRI